MNFQCIAVLMLLKRERSCFGTFLEICLKNLQLFLRKALFPLPHHLRVETGTIPFQPCPDTSTGWCVVWNGDGRTRSTTDDSCGTVSVPFRHLQSPVPEFWFHFSCSLSSKDHTHTLSISLSPTPTFTCTPTSHISPTHTSLH